jgi:dethiobiotin synthetase
VRGCFITGTDTGVGKTVLAGAVLAGLRRRGEPVRALKPVITGLSDPIDPDWPHDHLLLARAAGCDSREVMLVGYQPPVSPHLAAQLSGRPLVLSELIGAVKRAVRAGEFAVVEGVGGLLAPISQEHSVCDLAVALGLPIIVAARPGLGTINHTLLTLGAARSAGLEVAGVVLTPWPADPDAVQLSNRETIARSGAVEVATLPHLARADSALLAGAGQALPLQRWLHRCRRRPIPTAAEIRFLPCAAPPI